MYYYEVLVGSSQFHGNDALTYSSETILKIGTLVKVPLRNKPVLGFILQEVSKPSFRSKQITHVLSESALPPQSLQLIRWLQQYYPAPLGTIVRLFLPATATLARKESALNESASNLAQTTGLPPLTAEQRTAINAIQPSGFHIIHGITGSGKTRLYLELANEALGNNQSTILLTPEIGLTAQLTHLFKQQFGNKVMVVHSRLKASERRSIWHKLLGATHPVIVIGPRSALFMPIRNIGLIVIDECHDPAYKNDQSPHYRTERVAAQLARLHSARLILGSATPNIEDCFQASERKLPIIRLTKKATDIHSDATQCFLVDARDRTNFERSRLLSTPLIEKITQAIQHGQQTLLFLNRRATANTILCSDCGWQALCPNCDLSLAYHSDVHKMRCHSCSYYQKLPSSCPECGATDIILKTIGTQALFAETQKLFPTARIARFDSDVHKTEQLEAQLETIKSGSIDILIGTQMIAKGLDLPNLSVVGIVNADGSLLIPDYTANERTYQLLTQVMGRVGRGHVEGTVVIQSYNPDHPTLQHAITEDWQAFYERELAERKVYGFPPFVFLLQLTCARATSKSAEIAAQKLKIKLEASIKHTQIEGPTPSFHPKENGKYKWQLIVKSNRRSSLLRVIHNLPSGWQYNIDPINLL